MSQLAFKQLSSLGKTKVIAPYAFYHYSSRWGFLGDHLALHTALIYRNVRRHIVPCWKFCDQEASRIVWEKTDNLYLPYWTTTQRYKDWVYTSAKYICVPTTVPDTVGNE